MGRRRAEREKAPNWIVNNFLPLSPTLSQLTWKNISESDKRRPEKAQHWIVDDFIAPVSIYPITWQKCFWIRDEDDLNQIDNSAHQKHFKWACEVHRKLQIGLSIIFSPPSLALSQLTHLEKKSESEMMTVTYENMLTTNQDQIWFSDTMGLLDRWSFSTILILL